MLKFLLPKNSTPVKGDTIGVKNSSTKAFRVYRFNPQFDKVPKINTYHLSKTQYGRTVMDALFYISNKIDPTLVFRRSCKEGSCGTCGANVNKLNTLLCTSVIKDDNKDVEVYPLSGTSIIRDLVCDMDPMFEQYKSISPVSSSGQSTTPRDQSPSDRAKLDGLYDCIMCGCCTTRCPSYWWNEKEFVGPANLLQALRWVEDTREGDKDKRLRKLSKSKSLHFCHEIFSCTTTCPKSLNPAGAINRLKNLIPGK